MALPQSTQLPEHRTLNLPQSVALPLIKALGIDHNPRPSQGLAWSSLRGLQPQQVLGSRPAVSPCSRPEALESEWDSVRTCRSMIRMLDFYTGPAPSVHKRQRGSPQYRKCPSCASKYDMPFDGDSCPTDSPLGTGYQIPP